MKYVIVGLILLFNHVSIMSSDFEMQRDIVLKYDINCCIELLEYEMIMLVLMNSILSNMQKNTNIYEFYYLL